MNVTVRLINKQNEIASPLSCVNFIKSRLTIESFSNFSQDIDLVSQEILIKDTRFEDAPVNERSNVFTNILQPINMKLQKDIVQVEVHSRKRQDKVKFTILLNNMRLMGVFDWWESARKFILEDIEDTVATSNNQKIIQSDKSETIPLEIKLNVTDSEIVVVEDTSQWDTNAVIFKVNFAQILRFSQILVEIVVSIAKQYFLYNRVLRRIYHNRACIIKKYLKQLFKYRYAA